MDTEATLKWADYLVIVLMLCISSSIGIYYRLSGGKQKTAEEYFNANRSMSIIPVGIALMVSFMSAITLLGVSAENYSYGAQFVAIDLSYLLFTPVACYCYLPVFFKLQATSVYEYLEKRFGVGARLTASILYWVQLLLYSGVVLYAPAIALEATTGLSKTLSIVIIGLVCSFYSSIGGIKAVLITDVFQGVLMFAALFFVIGSAAYSLGALSEIWRIAEEGGRINLDGLSFDPTVRHTWWNLVIGGGFTFLSLYGVNQVQVQRLLTIRDLKSAQKALWLNYPILLMLSLSVCFAGLSMYSKYHDCDPIEQGRIESHDMLLPRYVVDTMAHIPGASGLFIAGIFSAGLSTISAALNSLAVITIEDYIKPCYRLCYKQEITPKTNVILGKLLAFTFGLSCIALAFLAQYFGSVLQISLTIFGVVGGPLLGVFTLGMLCQSANQRGAIVGMLTALCFGMWIAFGQPRPLPIPLPVSIEGCEYIINKTINDESITSQGGPTDPSSYFYFYRISYMWYSPIGFGLTMLIGLLISYLSRRILGEGPAELDPDLFFPFIANRILEKRRPSVARNGIEVTNVVFKNKKYIFESNANNGDKSSVQNTNA